MKLDINDLTENSNNAKLLNLNLENYAIVCQNQIIGVGVVENNVLKIKTYLADNVATV